MLCWQWIDRPWILKRRDGRISLQRVDVEVEVGNNRGKGEKVGRKRVLEPDGSLIEADGRRNGQLCRSKGVFRQTKVNQDRRGRVDESE
jgi:hypothetical protein